MIFDSKISSGTLPYCPTHRLYSGEVEIFYCSINRSYANPASRILENLKVKKKLFCSSVRAWKYFCVKVRLHGNVKTCALWLASSDCLLIRWLSWPHNRKSEFSSFSHKSHTKKSQYKRTLVLIFSSFFYTLIFFNKSFLHVFFSPSYFLTKFFF